MHTLTDNRIASMPSMRVNLLAWLPQTSEDVERIEVVLGPGAALYGPNTANGVLHIITKSPIDHPGSTVSMAGGERSVQHVIGRSAVRLNDRFGFKISGQYFRGNEWQSTDPVEVAARQAAEDDFDAWTLTQRWTRRRRAAPARGPDRRSRIRCLPLLVGRARRLASDAESLGDSDGRTFRCGKWHRDGGRRRRHDERLDLRLLSGPAQLRSLVRSDLPEHERRGSTFA
jgi:outer membrane receptor protein involved in Fe transport